MSFPTAKHVVSCCELRSPVCWKNEEETGLLKVGGLGGINMSYELILAAFPGDTDKAGQQLSRYDSSQEELGISEAIAIVKTEEGEDEVSVMGDPKKRGRRIGAVAGAMLGIIGGPAGMVLLGLGGAAAGNLVANLTHAGVSKEMIEKVEEGLEPGSSAVIVIVELERRDLILRDLNQLGATILSESVEAHLVEDKWVISPSSGMAGSQ
jgi:uncharacterized membrane protein